jgi:hypothetical protein
MTTSLPRRRNSPASSIIRSRCDTFPVMPMTSAWVAKSTPWMRSSQIVTRQSRGASAAIVVVDRSAKFTALAMRHACSTSML